jgi:hypothetical protein
MQAIAKLSESNSGSMIGRWHISVNQLFARSAGAPAIIRKLEFHRRRDTNMERPYTDGVRPVTGAEYLESVHDGREIWIYGERRLHCVPALRSIRDGS